MPDHLISNLDRIVPGFAEYLDSDENPFTGGTPAAIFAACSWFVREQTIEPECWRDLANLVNDAVAGPDESLSEAACTCFLENLADVNHPLKPFLVGEALEFWGHWEPVDE